jgi:putative transposase
MIAARSSRRQRRACDRLRRQTAVNGRPNGPIERPRATFDHPWRQVNRPRPVHGPSAAQRLLGPGVDAGFRYAPLPFFPPGPFTGLQLRMSLSPDVPTEAAMSKNCFSEIHLHLTWHTKESAPMLTPEVEAFVHRWLEKRIAETADVYVHEIGGTETHVHLAVTVAPTVAIAELIGRLKGASSHDANQHFGLRGKTLLWQSGYGVVSFGTRNLAWVKAYIRDQKARHGRGLIQSRLERFVEEEATQLPEPS